MSANAQQQPQPQPPKRRKRLGFRSVLLLLCAGLLAALAIGNSQPVDVWPFFGSKPLFLVIIASFLLGALFGWLAKNIIAGRTRRQALAERA